MLLCNGSISLSLDSKFPTIASTSHVCRLHSENDAATSNLRNVSESLRTQCNQLRPRLAAMRQKMVLTQGPQGIRCILFGLLAFSVASLVLLTHNLYQTFPAKHTSPNVPGCNVPQYDPFDPITKQFVKNLPPYPCERKPWLTKVVGNVLKVDWDVLVKHGESLVKCEYQVIVRESDDEVRFTESVSFTDEARLSEEVEFLQASCLTKMASGKEKNFRTYHHVLREKPEVERQLEKRLLNRNETLQNAHPHYKQANSWMNVMLVGLDSMSRFSTIRLMPRLRHFLSNQLHAIEMTNYNKVGDNTFPNILGLTTGRKVDEDSQDVLSHIGVITKTHMDRQDLRFLWNDFEEQGYMTLFAEDSPLIGAFNWNKGSGFVDPPTHYYYRPMELAKASHSKLFTHGSRCFAGLPNDELLLNYTLDFCRLLKDRPHFSLTFLCTGTHGDINGGSSVEGYHEQFLTTLKAEGLLDNTLLVYFSDHGVRGLRSARGFRKTPMGKFEEMRPFLFLAFPPWFREAYPDLVERVQENAARMTTPFDIHSTLLDVLYLGTKDPYIGQRKTIHGISLFDEIPVGRTCVDAGIPVQYCVCLKDRPLSTQSAQAHDAGTALIAALNAAQKDFTDKCHSLTLQDVTDFVQVDGGGMFLDLICDGFLPDKSLYRVTVNAQPSGAAAGNFRAYVNSALVKYMYAPRNIGL
ncbi:uncharacterized protein [Littorina saxatilis]|uniref:uncharacterized protein n=1 Tax=Littorina saxatilis TaxID=31220 RepID=UPI0038B4B190